MVISIFAIFSRNHYLIFALTTYENKTRNTDHYPLSQNHFVMEEIVLDNAPNDCISCVRYGKESDLLLVSSWDAVIVFGINLRLVDFTL